MEGEETFREPETLRFRPSGGMPNHPRWPVLLYRGVWKAGPNLGDVIENVFREHGWSGCWRAGVFDFHHFHSNAHEALGVAGGEAEILLGGPDGETVRARAGDLIVLPAGTGHKKISASPEFLVVGAYPSGQEDYDLRRADPATEEDAARSVSQVKPPGADPAFGRDGPLARLWT